MPDYFLGPMLGKPMVPNAPQRDKTSLQRPQKPRGVHGFKNPSEISKLQLVLTYAQHLAPKKCRRMHIYPGPRHLDRVGIIPHV